MFPTHKIFPEELQKDFLYPHVSPEKRSCINKATVSQNVGSKW